MSSAPYAWLCEREGCIMHPKVFYSKAAAEAWAASITVNPPVKITAVYPRPAGAPLPTGGRMDE